MIPALLTPDEVAERLRVSGATIRKLCRTGRLASIRFSQRILIDEADLDYFIACSRFGKARDVEELR